MHSGIKVVMKVLRNHEKMEMIFVQKKGSRIIVLTLVMLLLASAIPGALADTNAAIKARTTVYQSASTGAKHVTVINELSVKLNAIYKGWARIVRNGKTGYVQLKNLVVKDTVVVYALKGVTMYKSASTSSGKVGTFAKATPFQLGGISGNFAYVRDKSGQKGYIDASVITTKSPTSLSASEKVDRLMSVAKSLLGTPYSKLDCSTFTSYCFRQIGISISSGVRYQGYMRQYPQILSVKNLVRGDLVVFNTVADDDLSDHVGIYIGNGKFVHSSSAAGKVLVSQLTSGYYNRNFSWGLRIIK